MDGTTSEWNGMGDGGALWSDPIVRLGILVLGLLSLPFLFPLMSPEALVTYSEEYVDLVQFPLLILAFGYGLNQIRHPEARRFTLYMMAALALWWAIRVSYVLFPDAPGTLPADLAGDLGYLLFYLLVILGIESRPHLLAGWSAADPTRKLRIASAAVFVFTMLGYFVLIPSVSNYALYDTWLPSLYMYVALDLYLAARFVHASATCKSRRWRSVYALLGLVAASWAVLDLLECLSWAGRLDLPSGQALDLLWWIPLPLLVIAARIPHVDDESQDQDESAALFDGGKPGTFRAVAPQVILAFLLPGLHLAFYAAGLLDAESRPARDVLVLVSLVAFGVLVLYQQFGFERGNRALQRELLRLNEQLEQSQRMEAIGRLAGGVAHDFNNLLTAIMGHSRLLLERLPQESECRGEIEKIDEAGQRAATLTRQLLAFSRRQVLQPEIVDLNAVVSDMRDLVQRLIGEDVEWVAELDPELGRVRADRGPLEQVIMNLCVNARDAMPHGGRLTLQTRNEILPFEPDRHESEIPWGPQVVLVVRDTGCGMDSATRERVFEPFFTTKEPARGTGLGLSTVYGIVRQSGGQIHLESAPDSGTSVRIYLPRRNGESTPTSQARPNRARTDPRPSRRLPLGLETILLVEDEPAVRELACEILEMEGYRVLTTCNGQDALGAYERHGGRVDLLLTDLVMPVIGGRELARRLTQRQRDLKVLYVSGYTDETAFHEGQLESTAAFLGEPFTLEDLATKVGEVLAQA